MKTYAFHMLLVLMFVYLSACGSGATPEPTATPTLPPPPQPTNTAPPTETFTPTVDTIATQSALETAKAQAAAEAVADAQTQVAQEAGATSTALAGVKLTATAGVEATATAYAVAFLNLIEELNEAGVVTSTDGDYYRLDDFEGNMAQIDQPFVYFLGVDANNFAIAADMEWESASMKANWPTSGCGFVYGYKDRYNADLTFLGLDGYTYSLQFRQDKPLTEFAFKKWGDPERPKGNAKVMLVVYDKRVSVFVNDALANEFYNGLYTGGELGYNVFSGTNAGFGTLCKFSNVNLFIFK